MGTPLLLGREFSEKDSLNSSKVVSLSETTARAFFGTESPLGRMVGMEDVPGNAGCQAILRARSKPGNRYRGMAGAAAMYIWTSVSISR